MKVNCIKCDICGKEIRKGFSEKFRYKMPCEYYDIGPYIGTKEKIKTKYDMCGDCYRKIAETIRDLEAKGKTETSKTYWTIYVLRKDEKDCLMAKCPDCCFTYQVNEDPNKSEYVLHNYCPRCGMQLYKPEKKDESNEK